jgi:hypothetical protein
MVVELCVQRFMYTILNGIGCCDLGDKWERFLGVLIENRVH